VPSGPVRVRLGALQRLVDLTIEDLSTTPVWRYEGGSGAEAVVVPTGRSSLSGEDDEVCLAATEFILCDSSRHLGFCFPVDDSGLDYLQPVILTRAGQVSFWFDGPIAQEVLAAQWNALGKRAEEVFPVQFRCLVPVAGRTVTGVIPHVESSAETFCSGNAGPVPETARATGSGTNPVSRASRSVRGVRPTPARPLSAVPGMRRRKGRPPRHNVEMMVEFEHGDSRGTGVTRDISSGGMFVSASSLPNVGPSLQLTVHLPNGRRLELKGKVVRSASQTGVSPAPAPPGFGVRLTDQPPEYDELLSRLLGPQK
jgi:PilZ domain